MTSEASDSETVPLLSTIDSSQDHSSSESWLALVLQHLSRWKIIYLCGLLSFIIDFTVFMRLAPSIRMLELGICREYYARVDPNAIGAGGDIKENLCKISIVQSRLATTQGALSTLAIVPGLLLAVPYGILADRRGRKIVTLLGLFGLILGELYYYLVLSFYKVFPVQAVLGYPVFCIIGGGGVVLASAILAIIADVSPSSSRTRIFLLLSPVILISELLAPAAGSLLMEAFGAHLCFLLGIPIYLLSALVLYFIPETAPFTKIPDGNITDTERAHKHGWVSRQLQTMAEHIKVDLLPLLNHRNIFLGMISLLVQNFARPVTALLMQYMTVRFRWKFSQTAYLVSFQAMVQMFLLCLVLPLIHTWLTRKLDDPEKANLVLSQGSIVFLVLGTLVVGMAQTAPEIFAAIVVYNFGSGYGAAFRSFLTSLVPPSEVATLYTLIAVSGSVGALIGTPLLALAFSWGIKISGFALGLPFFVAAGLFAVSGISVWLMKIPQSMHDVSNQDEAA